MALGKGAAMGQRVLGPKGVPYHLLSALARGCAGVSQMPAFGLKSPAAALAGVRLV